jgi:hypothetical protein
MFIVIRATRALFQQFDNEIYPQSRGRHVRLMPIGVSAHPMAAFSGFQESHGPPPLGDVCGIVPAHRHGHRNSQQSGHILHRYFVCSPPGRCRGDMERVVTRWRHPVASGVALNMLNWVMHSVLLQCVCMAIKMACNGGTFVCRRHIFRLL